MSITNCNCMKINMAQIVSDRSLVQYFSTSCSFSAIANRTRYRNPSTSNGKNLLDLRNKHAVKLKTEATSLSGQYHQHLSARSLTTVGLGITKLLSFEKRFVSILALLRHNEYRKANHKKVTLPAKKPLNANRENRWQFLMFERTSFYYF